MAHTTGGFSKPDPVFSAFKEGHCGPLAPNPYLPTSDCFGAFEIGRHYGQKGLYLTDIRKSRGDTFWVGGWRWAVRYGRSGSFTVERLP